MSAKTKMIALKPEQAEFLERLVLHCLHGTPINDGEGLQTEEILRATEILKKLKGRAPKG